MKKTAYLLFAILIAIIAMLPASAEDLVFGDFAYILLPDGSAEITAYIGTDAELEIPGEIEGVPVTSIGENAFSSDNTLNHVSIPQSVTVIRKYAFAESANLRSADIPEGLLFLGDFAFQGCVSLEETALPAALVYIGANPFDRCTLLTSIEIAPENAYYKNEDGGVLFDREMRTLIAYPSGKEDDHYTIPETVEEISLAAFSENGFLEEITLQAQVKTINANPFCGCTALKSIQISMLNPHFESSKNALYDKDRRELIAYLWNSEESSYTIGAGIRSIGQEAFYKHSELKTVIIPDSVVTIGEAAFAESGLTEITIPDSVVSLGNSTFTRCPYLEKVKLPEGLFRIGDMVFFECESLKEVNFPNRLESIGFSAFNGCTSLKTVVFPEQLRYIGDYAFLFCTELEEVTFPDHLFTIGRAAFYGCDKLHAEVLKGSLAEDWAKQNEVPYTLKNVRYMRDEAI